MLFIERSTISMNVLLVTAVLLFVVNNPLSVCGSEHGTDVGSQGRWNGDEEGTGTPCSLNFIYGDDQGATYRINETGRNVTISVLQTSQEVTWSSANGTFNPETLVLSVTFHEYDGTFTHSEADVRWECTEIEFRFPNDDVWYRPDSSLKTIHLVYMTHLDVGFTDTARNVCDTYFNVHFPKAMETAAALRKLGGEERFVYTEFPWLIHEYLTGAAGCAHQARTPEQIANFTAAIEAGDISWHAMSLNMLTEMSDSNHFDWSLGNKDTLNRMLGKKNGMLFGKLTDVTGMSISVVPYLAKHGIQAVHVGYNTVCMFPDVPAVFRWQHEETGAEVLAIFEDNYGSSIRVSAAADTALVFMYTFDNGLPPKADDVIDFWTVLRKKYPAANINTVSPLDEYASVLSRIRSTLPNISMEIGDSWLYAAPADPYRISAYRTATKAIKDAVASGLIGGDNPALENYRYRLMKPMEHNWGLDVFNPSLHDLTKINWSNKEFYAVKNTSDYRRLEQEWHDQNEFCKPLKKNLTQPGFNLNSKQIEEWGVFQDMLSERLRLLQVKAHGGFRKKAPTTRQHIQPSPKPYMCYNRYLIGFNASDGSVNLLTDTKLNKTWLSPTNTAGLYRYRTYSGADFDKFNRGYNPECGPPCAAFSKNGMETANPESRVWLPVVTGFSVNLANCSFIAQLALPNTTHTLYGGPRSIQLSISLDNPEASTIGPARPTYKQGSGRARTGTEGFEKINLNVALATQDKPATRLAEAMFMSFNPIVADPSMWMMDILNHSVSPLKVVTNGTRYLHAVSSGVHYADNTTQVVISTEYTPLVSPADIDHLLKFDGTSQPDLSGGWHFDLYSNLWGNVFPQWSEENMYSEFSVAMSVRV